MRHFPLINQRQDYVKKQLLELYNTEKIAPVEYRLMQNYPNPFIRSTTIKYLLPEAANVVIKVYNTHGQQVASYRNQHDSEGHYSVEFTPRGRSSGIFFYTFEGGGHYEVKKMTILN